MPKQSEAVVLRTYPFREADLLVTLFTRLEGKVRGVAKSAKKSKRRFGGALEPLTHVIAHWEDKEKQELARLDSFEIISSPLASEVSYPRLLALGYVAEVIDQLHPLPGLEGAGELCGELLPEQRRVADLDAVCVVGQG